MANNKVDVKITGSTEGLSSASQQAEASLDKVAKGADKAKKKLKDAGDETDKFGVELGKTSIGLGNMSINLGATAAAAAPYAAAVAAAAAAAVGLATSAAEAGKQITTFARKAREDTETFQKLSYAMEQTGAEAEDLAEGLAELNLKIGEATTGGAQGFQDALKAMGLSLQELNAMDSEGRLIAIADALGQIQDQAKQGFFMEEIFGGDGRKMTGLLQQGGDGIRRLADEAERLGIIIDRETVAASAELSQQLHNIDLQTQRISTELGSRFLPAAERMSESMANAAEGSDVLGQGLDLVISYFEGLASGIGSYIGLWIDYGKAIGEFVHEFTPLPELIDLAGDAFDAASEGASDFGDSVSDAAGEAVDFIDEWVPVKDLLETIKETLQSIKHIDLEPTAKAANEVTNSIDLQVEAAKNSVKALLDGMDQVEREVMELQILHAKVMEDFFAGQEKAANTRPPGGRKANPNEEFGFVYGEDVDATREEFSEDMEGGGLESDFDAFVEEQERRREAEQEFIDWHAEEAEREAELEQYLHEQKLQRLADEQAAKEAAKASDIARLQTVSNAYMVAAQAVSGASALITGNSKKANKAKAILDAVALGITGMRLQFEAAAKFAAFDYVGGIGAQVGAILAFAGIPAVIAAGNKSSPAGGGGGAGAASAGPLGSNPFGGGDRERAPSGAASGGGGGGGSSGGGDKVTNVPPLSRGGTSSMVQSSSGGAAGSSGGGGGGVVINFTSHSLQAPDEEQFITRVRQKIDTSKRAGGI